MTDEITASDILAALDCAILETRDHAVESRRKGEEEDALIADNIDSGLSAFREYMRSHKFALEVLKQKKKKGKTKTS